MSSIDGSAISTRWVRKGGVIGVEGSAGAFFVPPAAVVYARFSNREGEAELNPTNDVSPFPDGFSDSVAEVRLIVERSQEGATLLSIGARARSGAEWFDISEAIQSGADHLIWREHWYPLDAAAMESLQGLRRELNLEVPGPITIRQYLQLVGPRAATWIVDDRTGGKVDSQDLAKASGVTIETGALHLYPYQEDGVRWLRLLVTEQIGGLLADEMGLGKTVQIIGLFLASPSEQAFPALIICPASILENWRRELQRFAPSATVMVHQGPERTGDPNVLSSPQIVITSYETVVRDLSLFRGVIWRIVVADEAQALKNPESLRNQSIKQLRRIVFVAVTGTPLENRLRDLWSLMGFAIPGLLGDLLTFERTFEKQVNGPRRMADLLAPVVLRRKVSEVAKDLPRLVDIPQFLTMDADEAKAYEALRRTLVDSPHKPSFAGLMKLRMFCTHPSLVRGHENWELMSSVKYVRLLEILEEILLSGEKALVFTGFTRMIKSAAQGIQQSFGVPAWELYGEVPVPERQELIDHFTRVTGGAVLVLNPKAGGVGLNITAANHVVHVNADWNPAVQDQATKRAHRLGQTRPVTAHRLIYSNTIEEIIEERLLRKRRLAEEAVTGTDGQDSDLEDIIRAIKVSPFGG